MHTQSERHSHTVRDIHIPILVRALSLSPTAGGLWARQPYHPRAALADMWESDRITTTVWMGVLPF